MRPRGPSGRLAPLLRGALAVALGVGLALLVGCGSPARELIPSGQAGPLLGDFEAVQHAAENGNGNCAATNAAISKTEHDYAALPSSVDAGLRTSLRQGIENLGARARELCTQPSSHGSTTSTTPTLTTPTTATTPAPSTKKTEPETPPETSTGAGGTPPSEEQPTENPGGAESEEPPTGHSPGEEGTG